MYVPNTLNSTEFFSAASESRCSLCDIVFTAVALANRLISLSDVPSSRILETFSREFVQRS